MNADKNQEQSAPLLAAIRWGVGGLILVVVVAVALSTALAGTPGLWGALIGAAVGGGFVLATVVTLYLSRNLDPTTTGAVLLGSWLVKLVIALVVMMALRRMDFYDKGALVGTIIAALVVLLAAETIAVQRTKVPYTEPAPTDEDARP